MGYQSVRDKFSKNVYLYCTLYNGIQGKTCNHQLFVKSEDATWLFSIQHRILSRVGTCPLCFSTCNNINIFRPLDKTYLNKYSMSMDKSGKKITVVFFKNDRGKEPVRKWLTENITPENRKIIGTDIKTVEMGWPIGMPTCKPLGQGLYEVRSGLTDGTAARVLFTIHGNHMVLLHGFIKKGRKTPTNDLRTAKNRLAKFKRV